MHGQNHIKNEIWYFQNDTKRNILNIFFFVAYKKTYKAKKLINMT